MPRTVADIKSLNQALIAFCLTNGRPHDQKSPLEQQADDLAAILHMKLEMLIRQAETECGKPACGPAQRPSQDDQLAGLLADLALMAQGGTLRKVLGSGADPLMALLSEVQSAGDVEFAAGLEGIDRGNYLRASGETRSRLALMREKQNLIDKKLG